MSVHVRRKADSAGSVGGVRGHSLLPMTVLTLIRFRHRAATQA
jgi:hypothetical protein